MMSDQNGSLRQRQERRLHKNMVGLSDLMDHSPINQNFDLNKSGQNSFIA